MPPQNFFQSSRVLFASSLSKTARCAKVRPAISMSVTQRGRFSTYHRIGLDRMILGRLGPSECFGRIEASTQRPVS